MSQKELAKKDDDDKTEVKPLSPFWAVMLAGPDTGHLVNMFPITNIGEPNWTVHNDVIIPAAVEYLEYDIQIPDHERLNNEVRM